MNAKIKDRLALIAFAVAVCAVMGVIAQPWKTAAATASPAKTFDSSKPFTLTHAFIGCVDKDQTIQLARIASENDAVAWSNAIGQTVASGACEIVNPGSVMHVEDVHPFDGVALVRAQGEAQAMYYPLSIIPDHN